MRKKINGEKIKMRNNKISSRLDYIKFRDGELIFNYGSRKEIIRSRVYSIV